MNTPDISFQRLCVKAWLSRIRSIDSDTRYFEQQIEVIRSRLAGIGYDPSSQGGSASISDTLGEGIGRIEELERQWSDRIGANYHTVEAARRMCSPMHEGRYCLWLNVVEGIPWKHVAQRLNCSVRKVHRLATVGVEELYPLIPERFKREPFPDACEGWSET